MIDPHSIHSLNKYIVLFLIFSFSVFSEEKRAFHYLYIDANTGDSSGGHSAIQFGEKIFHFQFHPDGIFHLERQKWKDFQRIYRVLENRNIYSARIEASHRDYILLESEFNRLFLARKRQLQILQWLREEKTFFAKAEEEKQAELSLPSVGYIEEELPDACMKELIGHNYNRKNVSLELSKIQKDLDEFPYETNFIPQKKNELHYPSLSGISLYSLKQKLMLYHLFLVLSGQRKYNENSFLHLTAITDFAKIKIFFIKWKKIWKSEFEEAIQTKNPDPERAFIALSRFGAACLSLKNRNLTFPMYEANREAGLPIDPEWLKLFKTHKARLAGDLQKALDVFSASEEIHIYRYLLLEELFNKAYRFLYIGQQGGILYPVNHRAFPDKHFKHKIRLRKDLNLGLKKREAKERYDSYRKILQEQYPFRLLQTNCTTELFRVINNTFNSSYIGNEIKANEEFNFIPFYAFASVEKKYPLLDSKEILSLRREEVKRIRKKLGIVKTFLEESNTISSSIYQFHSRDSFFLFFTDDTLFFRPVFGSFNLLAGGLQTVYGTLSFPFDRGKHLLKGGRGMFFSLPELFFFNIRKGTFPYKHANICELSNENCLLLPP
ncbi:MAG: hypothetical protein H7A25_04360 [Leptospiraceae bacterium]|nr:hypothetical protein [Leptospiraceae bacterium]MCP5499110.1 hypothetical protein [Leptospiraceae bacterium]